MDLKQWALARLKEKTTYIGFSLLLGVVGVAVTPDQAEMIAMIVLSFAGVSNIMIKEVK